jgi:ATP-binding protein involved in chromosome partitioning
MTRLKLARQTVLVTGLKGGVGKSTVASSLAVTLARLDLQVGLVDFDLAGASVPYLLACHDRPKARAGKIIPPVAERVKFISSGSFASSDDAMVWRGPLLRGIIRQFVHDVEWGRLDVLLVDLPAGSGEVHAVVLDELDIDGAIVVTIPSVVARDLARRASLVLNAHGTPVVASVLNRVRSCCAQCGWPVSGDDSPKAIVTLPELAEPCAEHVSAILEQPGFARAIERLASETGLHSVAVRRRCRSCMNAL